MKQTIAIIGAAGRMGTGLARKLAGAGHRLLLAGPTRSRLENVQETVIHDTPDADVEILDCEHEASWEADIVIPAVPYAAQAEIAARIKDVVTGKIVVSIANPLNATYDGLVTAPTTSAAEELAELLPHSKVVKAFNTVFSGDFDENALEDKADCFVAGDNRDAVAAVSQLVRDAGFHPVVAGGLPMSRTLENLTLLLIRLRAANGRVAGWNIVYRTSASVPSSYHKTEGVLS